MTLLRIGLPVILTSLTVYESTEPGIPSWTNHIDGTGICLELTGNAQTEANESVDAHGRDPQPHAYSRHREVVERRSRLGPVRSLDAPDDRQNGAPADDGKPAEDDSDKPSDHGTCRVVRLVNRLAHRRRTPLRSSDPARCRSGGQRHRATANTRFDALFRAGSIGRTDRCRAAMGAKPGVCRQESLTAPVAVLHQWRARHRSGAGGRRGFDGGR
jgi:hypothetical protein